MVVRRTKYAEDEWPGNHTSVWGSYYDKTGKVWGYACCHATTHNAYCVGKAGWSSSRAFSEPGVAQVSGASVAAAAAAQAKAEAAAASAAAALGEKRKKSTLSGKHHPLAGAHGGGENDEVRQCICMIVDMYMYMYHYY